jgi:hypothetical protein
VPQRLHAAVDGAAQNAANEATLCACMGGWVGVYFNEFNFDIQRAFVRAWGLAVVRRPEFDSAHTASFIVLPW